MSLMHFEPFRSVRDLDRLASQLLSGTQVPLPMPMDVWREGQTYRVALDLPGVDPGAIEVHVERNTLTVSARREPSFGGGGGRTRDDAGGGAAAGAAGAAERPRVLVAERPQGTFSRQLVLGEGLDTSAVQADYVGGVLHLTIPVSQAAQPRRIQVGQRGGSQGDRGDRGDRPRVIEGDSGSAGAGQPGGTA